MGKHAYLILAHHDDAVFRTLLRLLDDERNDIFIHMDAKCASYQQDDVERACVHAQVRHTVRTSCTWGAYSMVNAEMLLLEMAVASGRYDFLHLISGQDLPIKSQQRIHAFFDQHQGEEFVRFNFPDFRFADRVNVYHILQERLGRKSEGRLNRALMVLQRLLGVRRNRGVSFQKGTQWFSITGGFAAYVVSQRDWVLRTFRMTRLCDELFIQTLLIRSPFKDRLYHKEADNDLAAIMRLIDWTRGDPYVFRKGDFDELVQSPYLFARKFDAAVDPEIVAMVADFDMKADDDL